MKKTSRTVTALGLALAMAPVLFAVHMAAQQMQAGPNVNMAGGPASITLNPFKIVGDPYLQRRNEPSMACSSRNPLNCLAGANDYRLVSVPTGPDGKVTGDAWLGVFWTRDGGNSWRSTVLPGSKPDNTPEGLKSPLKGFDAAADPTVRAGSNGLFYYSGIAFNETAVATKSSLSEQEEDKEREEGKTGVVFVSTFIDDNNTQDPGTPPRYIRTSIVARGEDEKFLDKPWLAVGLPNAQSRSCSIAGQNGSIKAGTVFVAYTTFINEGDHVRSSLKIQRSTDCGKSWSEPRRLSEKNDVSQSAVIAIDPKTNRVYAGWREFANSHEPAQLFIAWSDNDGREFTKPIHVATLGTMTTSAAFDQPTLPDAAQPAFRMFRTNTYPALCVDAAGVAHMAWSQVGVGPEGDARIVTISSANGRNWSAPTPIEPIDQHPGRGHQLMPSLACAGMKVTALWYDQRDDLAVPFVGPPGRYVADTIPPAAAHTVDVRAAQANIGAVFEPSIRVSRYYYTVVNGVALQLQANAENLPLYGGGKLPFLGDYIDLAAMREILPPANGGNWTFNTTEAAPVLHAVWTDNRDILGSGVEDFVNWTRVGTACPDVTRPTLRNQNIYTARLATGLIVEAPGNSRPLSSTVQRAFPVVVRNTTDQARSVRVLIANQPPPNGKASFLQDFPPTKVFAPETTVEVQIPARSSVSRTVYVNSPVANASIRVEAKEWDGIPNGNVIPNGLQSFTFLNPDSTNPAPLDPAVVNFDEKHMAAVGAPTVTSYANPFNPTFLNPTFLNPTFLNPTFLNPTFLNQTFLNPTFLNPTFLNPTFLNPAIGTLPVVTDITTVVQNVGNVPTEFDYKTVSSIEQNPGFVFQLLVYRIYKTPVARPDCTLGETLNQELMVNVENPTFLNPTFLNPTFLNTPPEATFTLNAGDYASVKIRVVSGGTPENPTFNPKTVTGDVKPAAVDPAIVAGGGTAPAAPIVAAPDVASTLENAPVTFNVLANDTDTAPGATLSLLSVSPAVHGTLTFTATGSVTYTPNVHFNGTEVLFYTAVDTFGRSASSGITITVIPVNDPPVADAQSVTTNEETAVAVTLTGSDVETPDLIFSIGVGPSHGILSGTPPNVTYTPAPDYNGTDAFTFSVADKGDPSGCAPVPGPCAAPLSRSATVSITVNPVNDPPVAVNDAVTINEDGTATGNVLGNDTDIDTPHGQLTAVLVSGPAHAASFALNADGSFSYMPAADYNGSDGFTYKANDGSLDSNTATVTITVSAVNDPPVANADTYQMANDGSTLMVAPRGVLANDTDVDNPPSALTAVLATGVSHGTLAFASDGSFTYKPFAGFSGTDTFTYNAFDGQAPSLSAAIVEIAVLAPPSSPLAITNVQLLDAIVNSPYPPSPQALQATGGVAPYTWSIDPDAKVDEGSGQVPAILPPDLALNPNSGVISGTPTTTGAFAFRVIVTDAAGQKATQNFCIHVDPSAGASLLVTDLTTVGETEAGLASLLVDPDDAGVVIANATFTGDQRAGGRFSGGGDATQGIGFDSGILLSSGAISGAKGPNNSGNYSTAFCPDNVNRCGDAQLDALSQGVTHDAAILEFDFTPTCHNGATDCNVTFEYVFGSDEYNEYANSSFNDVFGFFLTDNGVTKNFALLPGVVPETPVSINMVNGGNPVGTNAKNPQLFRNNSPGTLNVQADGLTVPLQFNAPVVSGHTYHIKLGIADVTDAIFDSWVFVKAGSLKVTHVCPIVVP